MKTNSSSILFLLLLASGCISGSEATHLATETPISTTVFFSTPISLQETPSASPTMTATPIPMDGELFFQVGLYKYYEIKLPSLEASKIIDMESSGNSMWFMNAVPTGYIYFLAGRIQEPFQAYRTDLDGSNLKRITNDYLSNMSLSASPDGSRIAIFQAENSSREYITVIDYRNHGAVKRIFSSPKLMVGFLWSPNGQELAVPLLLPDHVHCCDLYLMDATGQNPNKIATNVGGYAWSPDNNQIAISTQNVDAPALYIVDINSGKTKKLVEGDISSLFWSPRGDKILFIQEDTNYCTISPNGTDMKVLANMGANFKGSVNSAAWSPDGRYVAFVKQDGDAQNLYLVSADDGTPIQLATNVPFDQYQQISMLSWINVPRP
jgi:tricorn protease-like protein